MKYLILKRWLIILVLISCSSIYVCAQNYIDKTFEYEAKLDIASIFAPFADLSGGIIGTVYSDPDGYDDPDDFFDPGIFVSVYEKMSDMLIYRMYLPQTSSTNYDSNSWIYDDMNIEETGYFPSTWDSKDIKSSVFAIDKYRYENSDIRPYPFLKESLNVRIVINVSNAYVENVKIPGVGYITNFSHGQLMETNPMFSSVHKCYHNSPTNCPCDAWVKFKQPNNSNPSDLILIAHRGMWGNNTTSWIWGLEVGGGPPENSKSAIKEAYSQVKAIEVDIMGTKDLKNRSASNKLILSHDYSLNRLSNYSGSKYWFELSYKDIVGTFLSYKLKKRNESLSSDTYLSFESLLSLLKSNNLVALIDIKTLMRGTDKNGVIVNGQYDPNTDAGKAKILENYADIFRECYKQVKERGLEHYIAFKTSYSYNEIRTATHLDDVELSKILYMPMRHPKVDTDALNTALQFIDNWSNAVTKKKIIAIETNFMTLGELISFKRQNVTYNNLLHYVVSKGIRPGIFSVEPVGAKGVVNRWPKWNMKNTQTDIRGDHFALMSVPEFKTAVITTDRVDVWKQINNAYNNGSNANLLSANSKSNITKIENPDMNKNTGINARYESGNIIISGLERNHIGSDVFLYDLQGLLICKDIVKTEPQMIIVKRLQTGIYILNISGNQQASIKILIN
jgi:glycerophosphoryl diester phosphodiesterase